MFGNFVLSDELQRASGFYFFSNETFHDSFCGEIEGYFFASLTELVGEFVLRESPEFVV